MSFYALLISSSFLLLWGAVVTNKGNFTSFILVKVIPAALGIWGLWESAIVYLSNN